MLWKLSSSPTDFIFEEKTPIGWKINKLSKDLTKCPYTFGTYFSCDGNITTFEYQKG